MTGRAKSPLRTCGHCGRRFAFVNKEEFCSPKCVAGNRVKRRAYFRARYLARKTGSPLVWPSPGRPIGTNQGLVRKVAREWRCSVDRAREYIQSGSFPP